MESLKTTFNESEQIENKTLKKCKRKIQNIEELDKVNSAILLFEL